MTLGKKEVVMAYWARHHCRKISWKKTGNNIYASSTFHSFINILANKAIKV